MNENKVPALTTDAVTTAEEIVPRMYVYKIDVYRAILRIVIAKTIEDCHKAAGEPFSPEESRDQVACAFQSRPGVFNIFFTTARADGADVLPPNTYHEAFHCCNQMCAYYQLADDGVNNEATAYLIGAIGSCIEGSKLDYYKISQKTVLTPATA